MKNNKSGNPKVQNNTSMRESIILRGRGVEGGVENARVKCFDKTVIPLKGFLGIDVKTS